MHTTLDSIRDIKLYQPKHGYRFSVDALLLYSFINLKHIKRIADLGAGSGIIGLLLAKKYPSSEVTLIEIQKSLFELSQKNIILNKLENRVKAIRADLRRSVTHLLTKGTASYDLAVSNPPFRCPLTGKLSHEEEKSVARHEIKLKLPELLMSVSLLLKAKGRFSLIYLPERLIELIEEMRKAHLEPKRLRFVHSKASSPAKMLLMEAVKDGRAGLSIERPMFIYGDDGTYSEEMRGIYGI
ncbi:MAG: tRNA1(Val) (adenine(37)-N6)-methyltransferase [Nitrospirae bacterium]|nr:tRNA1(Val) (adenine(37)-N6)-methyltransferase [Nitrospirota bacterium]